MPRDALYEESAQPINAKKQASWYMTFHVLFWIFAVLTGIHLSVCIMVIPTSMGGLTGVQIVVYLLWWIAPAIALAVIAFIFARLRRRFNVSYDYIFVKDELRIIKVFNGKKRKHLVTLEADHMLQIGYCEGTTFERTYAGMKGSKPKVMSPNREPAEEKDFIHIVYSSSLGKTLYILECRKEMLEHLVFAAGRNKFVRE